jgi:hypothetical protein
VTVRLEELLAAATATLRDMAGYVPVEDHYGTHPREAYDAALDELDALARANAERDRLLIDMGEALAKYRANHRDFLGGGCMCERCHTSDALLARLDRIGRERT